MRRPWLRWLLACALASVGGLGGADGAMAAPPPPYEASDPQLDALREAIEAVDLEQAEQVCAVLERTRAADPVVSYYRGLLLFFRGDYAAALERVDSALSGTAAGPGWLHMRGLIHDTLEVTRGFVRVASADGRYVVMHAPGKDALMAPYALDVLTKADAAVEEALGLHLPGPIRLEIFPTASALAQVSALTVEQIETSGTIALSKWDRLMITSPRALVRGYPWADTINHELVHMVLSRLTGERAPVWLQEGLAKLLEGAWRTGKAGVTLDPGSRALLEQAVTDHALITFDEMHPSIAMLPSQDAAALAFAEVSTFMDDYAETHGMPTLRTALGLVRRGMDAREALSKAAETPFTRLERTWRAGLPQGPGTAGAPRRLQRRLRGGEGKQDESVDVVVEAARRFLRLGDLLWDRGRVGAAAHEYEKAHEADRDDPIVAARYARAALEAGAPARARDAIAPLAARYPDHAPAHAVLGAAWLALGRPEDAAPALRAAVMVNPFDPQPQCDLARSTTFDAERARAQAACDILRGH